ncbi:hypothetical protein LEN26_015814 [Aphanomyces euteiches]|nr:hypothetical protein LEN26_015814 [Aphanomyces euteiches]
MEIAIAACIELYGTVDDIKDLDKVCRQWRERTRERRRWRSRFKREFASEYESLGGNKDDTATIQDWRMLHIHHSLSYSSGFHKALGTTNLDERNAEAILLRHVFITGQAIKALSRGMSDVLHATRPELLPMEEVKHWHRVVVDLKALENEVEQVLASSIEDKWVALRNQLQENLHALRKIHNQAQWNAKYFKVLEKPFQDILSSDMKHITYMVPAMIKTLKMMWSSSKYYHDCFKMGALLARIANALCARVCSSVCIDDLLLGDDFDASIDVVESAGSMLERWHDVYDTSSTVWGPFDVYALFHRVDCVAQRCSECRSALVLLRQIRCDMVCDQNSSLD